MIIVECFEPVTKKPTGQLVLDALTDAVVYFKGDRFGKPYLSPDSRKLITITHSSDGTTLMLQFVKGLYILMSCIVKLLMRLLSLSFSALFLCRQWIRICIRCKDLTECQ